MKKNEKNEENANLRNSANDILADDKFPKGLTYQCNCLNIYLEIKKIKLDAIANGHSNKVSNGNGKADMTSEPVSSPSKTEVTEIFRCETCGATFGNLLNFMDHKNTLCNTSKIHI